MSTPTALAVGIVLLALNGFFVAAEFALLAARRSRLEQLAGDGSRVAARAVASLRELTVMLAGAQLGITMASLGLGAVGEPAVAHVLEDVIEAFVDVPASLLHTISFVVALSIVVFLHMVLGEMAPKSWAISDPERSALRLITPFRVFTTLMRPLLVMLNGVANLMVRLVRVDPKDEVSMARSSAELQVLFQAMAAEGGLDRGVTDLLTRSLELSGVTAAEAMTPREDIVALPAFATLAEAADLAQRTRRSRLVVHGGELDDVRGVLLARDVLMAEGDASDTLVDTALRGVVVVRAADPVEDLLLEMRNRRQLAVVLDEGDRVVGVVTVQDVLDRLVGQPAVRVSSQVRPPRWRRGAGRAQADSAR